MLDINFIRDNKEEVQKNASDKGVDVNIESILTLDSERRVVIQSLDTERTKRNEIAEKISNSKEKPSEELISEGRLVKDKIGKIENELAEIEAKLKAELLKVPNMVHESVMRADGEEGNRVIKTVGHKPSFNFEVKDHQSIGEDKDLIDIKTASEVSGSRFYYLKGDLVLLEQALVSWVLNKLASKNFTPVTVPTLVREKMMEATGFFPADRNEIYSVNPGEDDLFLVGTSEVPLTGLHMLDTLDEEELPKFYVGYSTCYRREAGSYGKDTKGILRVHQFNKLEMYCFSLPEESWKIHEKMLAIEEEILTELGLHYQVVNIGSGDLGAPAAKKYDCEVWIPSQEKFRELTSCSNCTDYQARRANIRFRDSAGKLQFAHTLNGTAMASTRTLIAIIENYQNEDGSISIPDVLKPFMGGRETI